MFAGFADFLARAGFRGRRNLRRDLEIIVVRASSLLIGCRPEARTTIVSRGLHLLRGAKSAGEPATFHRTEFRSGARTRLGAGSCCANARRRALSRSGRPGPAAAGCGRG